VTFVGTVLVVEDDDLLAGMLEVALESEGYEVKSAANGEEALAVLGSWRPGLIFLDLMMPVMDGWAFREAQSRIPRLASIPVVVFTAVTNLEDRTRRLGAVEIITKPCDLDELFRAVRKAIGPVAA